MREEDNSNNLAFFIAMFLLGKTVAQPNRGEYHAHAGITTNTFIVHDQEDTHDYRITVEQIHA